MSTHVAALGGLWPLLDNLAATRAPVVPAPAAPALPRGAAAQPGALVRQVAELALSIDALARKVGAAGPQGHKATASQGRPMKEAEINRIEAGLGLRPGSLAG